MSTTFIFHDDSEDAIKKIRAKIPLALEMVAREFEHHAKDSYVPVDTGRLKNSITHDPVTGNEVYIGSDVEYAAYVEIGTSRMGGRHYLKRAGDSHRDEYADILAKYLTDE